MTEKPFPPSTEYGRTANSSCLAVGSRKHCDSREQKIQPSNKLPGSSRSLNQNTEGAAVQRE